MITNISRIAPWSWSGRGNVMNSGFSEFKVGKSGWEGKDSVRPWQLRLNCSISSPPAIGKNIIYSTCFEPNRLVALSMGTGSVLWSFESGDRTNDYSSVNVDEEGNIYVYYKGIMSTSLVSLTKNGFVNWNFSVEEIKTFLPTPLYFDKHIYTSFGTSNLYCITTDGSLKWMFEADYEIFTSPAINVNSSQTNSSDYVLYFVSTSTTLYALSASHGSLLWKSDFYSNFKLIFSSPSIGISGDIYFGSVDNFVFAYLPNGTLKWKSEDLGDPVYASVSIDSNGTLYVPSSDNFFSLNPNFGSIIWRKKYSSSGAAMIDGNNNIYFASNGFYALNSEGSVLWRKIELNNQISGYPYYLNSPSIGSNGLLYMGSYDKAIFAFKFGTSTISQNDNSNNSKNNSLVYILVFSCFGVFGMLLFFCFYKLKQSRKYEKNVSEELELHSIYASIGSFGSPLSNELRDFKNNSEEFFEVDNFSWNSIQVNKATILGEGSFGTVIKAFLKPLGNEMKGNIGRIPIAIKLFCMKNHLSFNDESLLDKVTREIKIIKQAQRHVLTDCTVRVFGVVNGKLPDDISAALFDYSNSEYIGIVMRFEGGGTLEKLLYPKKGESEKFLSLEEKLRILTQISSALTELHTIGIIHGDLKPANILLSHHNPPDVRLADFGVSLIKDGFIQSSTLEMTVQNKSTPLYSAPEMIVNPLDPSYCESVAKASRKTDVYALSILVWEVLCRKRPFQDISSKVAFSTKIHQGYRPNISELPNEIQASSIETMLVSCWSDNRSKRKSAIEFYSVLHHTRCKLNSYNFDIYIYHHGSHKELIGHVYKLFVLQGFRVWLNEKICSDSNDDKNLKIRIENSQLLLVFMTNDSKRDVFQAISIGQHKIVCIVVLEELNKELLDCINQFEIKKIIIDLSNLCTNNVSLNEGHEVKAETDSDSETERKFEEYCDQIKSTKIMKEKFQEVFLCLKRM